MKKILWEEMRRTELEQAAADDAIVIIPTGSTEQHGDHLPVNTDSNTCFTIATRTAQAIDDFPVLVLPPIWTGYSPWHTAYRGTITLNFHLYVEVLSQVAKSVSANGFKKILFLNGHGGNKMVVGSMTWKLCVEEQLPSSVLAYNWWELPSVMEGFRGDHAGELETSVQLYLQPKLVDSNAAIWAPGVLGDPSAGTREKGERLINTAVNALVKVLRDYRDGKIEDVWGKKVFKGRQ